MDGHGIYFFPPVIYISALKVTSFICVLLWAREGAGIFV